MKFSSMTGVTEYVTEALGEYAGQFDIAGIADEVSAWEDGRLVVDEDGFWETVARHDLTQDVGSGVRDPGFRLVP